MNSVNEFSKIVCLHQAGDFQKAQDAYLKFLQKQPQHAEAMSGLATLYLQTDQLEQALLAFEQATKLNPSLPGLQNKRAMTLQNLHRFDEALQAYDAAIEQMPNDSVAQANKGMLCLLLGRFETAWPLYEARWQHASMALHPELNAYPRWNGQDDLSGKMIVLHAEQGFGDTIQFCRYALPLALRARQVILVVNKELYSLLHCSVRQWQHADNILVISAGATIPAFHCQIPVLSLPAVLNTNVDTIPDPGTYIFVPDASAKKWFKKLPASNKPRIGLVWSGSAKHSNDKKRSLQLRDLLIAVQSQTPTQASTQAPSKAQWELHSLQKEVSTSDQQLLQQQQVYQHGADLLDFADTAALIHQMDLVITVDTSVAHLACAMGKPCWILLASLPDFRWLLERNDSPWYRSARLFRQALASDWPTLLEKVASELKLCFQDQATKLHSMPDPLAQMSQNHTSIIDIANQQVQQGLWQEAELAYRQQSEVQTHSAILQNNWGVVLQKLRRFDEALERFDRAIQFDPDYVSPRLNKAMCLLSLGQFDEGWTLYEWRWKNAQWDSSKRNFSQPLWMGQKLERGSTLLIYAEQGLGDTLQFCRLLSLVQDLVQTDGVEVIFEVPASLVKLLQCLPVPVFARIAASEPMPAFNYQCPLLSLPLALQLQVEAIPQQVPYLKVEDEKERQWALTMPSSERLKIGVVWAGSTQHQNDKNRSIPFSLFSPLLQLDADYYVLQKELTTVEKTSLEMMQRFGKRVNILASTLADFTDTAAAINNLDLIISVDTSVAHLAGALGKPLYLLLPYEADFRWMHERNDTVWYPSALLFRQVQPGDWKTVIQIVRAQLTKER
jgi:tetratricopeptide (TPR) repeat protein